MNSIAYLLTKGVPFSYGGHKWPLVVTYRSLLMCEQLTGADMLSARMVDPSFQFARAMLYCLLSCAGAKCTVESVGKSVSRRAKRMNEALTKAWVESMGEPEVKQGSDDTPGDADDVTWLTIWSKARHDLRLTDAEFLDMTPAQFKMLQKRRLDQLRREDFMVGLLASKVVNYSMGAPKQPTKPEDFMIHKFPNRLPPELVPHGDVGEQIVAQMGRYGDDKVQTVVSEIN